MNYKNEGIHHHKKPKPLFGLFRKTNNKATTPQTKTTKNLGSGTSNFMPLNSSIISSSLAEPQKKLTLRKYSSAHDLRKSIKLQQDSIHQLNYSVPLPRNNLSRSKSLNNNSQKVSFLYHIPPPLPIRDDDDNIPLGYLQSPKPSSLLSDREDEDDKDLIPIAIIDNNQKLPYQSAADKYKERVKERLKISNHDDDDNLPISLLYK